MKKILTAIRMAVLGVVSRLKFEYGFKHTLSKSGYIHLMILTFGIGRNGIAMYFLNFWISVVFVSKSK